MRQFLADEWRALASLNRSDRTWEMPVAAALASGLADLHRRGFWRTRAGLAASLGGLVFLHLPPRACHTAWLADGLRIRHDGQPRAGLLGHLIPALVVPLLVTITLLVTLQ
jgi:hypothetical protein